MTDKSREIAERLAINCIGDPHFATRLRGIIKQSLAKYEPGSEAHNHLLRTLNSLDLFCAQQETPYESR